MGKVQEVQVERRGLWLSKSGQISYGLGAPGERPAICIPLADYDQMKAGAEAAAKVEGLEKDLAEKKAEIEKLQKANEGFITNVNSLGDELTRCKDVLEATIRDKEALVKQISELETAAKKIDTLVAEQPPVNPADNHTIPTKTE